MFSLLETAEAVEARLEAALSPTGLSMAKLAVLHVLVEAREPLPLSGLIALAGGLSVLLGYRAKVGAWLLVVFLVPITLAIHNFWAVHDPMAAQIQQVMFMKNLSMLGAALLISYFGAGPLSFDARRAKDFDRAAVDRAA